MKNTPIEYVVVGKIGSTYGIQGWLKVHSFADNDSMLEYAPWYWETESGWQVIPINASRKHNKGVIAQFTGYTTPEQAKRLTGKKIAVMRNQLPKLKKDEYYWADLENLTVINQRGEKLGDVAYLMATGANDVVVIKDPDGKEHAIPFLLKTIITRIDLDQKIMQVDWDLI